MVLVAVLAFMVVHLVGVVGVVIWAVERAGVE